MTRSQEPHDPITRLETLEQRLLLADVQVAVSFQPAEITPPDGFVVDVGQTASPQADNLTYGWDRDLTKATRTAKKISDQPGYDSFIAAGRATWNVEVPNGIYSIEIAAGNGKAGRRQRIEVEDVVLIDGKTTRETRWLEGTAAITVSDGAVTVSPVGKFKGNKLAQIRIRSADVDAPPSAGAPEPGAKPAAVAWSDAGIVAAQTRVEPAIATVGNRLYIMGGYVNGLSVNRTSDILDATTGVWRKGPEIRGAQTHAGVTSDGTRMIYKAGGQLGGGIPGTPTDEVWRLDTANNTWKQLPALPEGRYAPGMAHINGKLHVFGGTLPDRTTVTTDHWVLDLNALKQGWQQAPALPEGGDHLSTIVLDNKIYAIGGEHGHATQEGVAAPYIQHSHHYRFDPATSEWIRMADLPTARSHAEGTTIAIEGKILFMGGKLNPNEVADNMDLYDPETDTWTPLGSLPAESQGGAAIYHQGRIYLSHGQIGGPSFEMHRTTWIGTVSFA